MKRILILFLVVVSAGVLCQCRKSKAPEEVNLVYYLWGSEGVANQDILKEINTKLKADLNATLEIKYIDWPEISTRYPLLFASGEPFDMSHASPGAAAPYFTLAAQGALADLTALVDTAVPALKAAIPAGTWNGAKFNGKIYGVPCLYSEFTTYGYVHNRNLLQKYGLQPINSIASLEAYMDAVVKNERFPPINGDSNDAVNLYRMMVALTGKWLDAPGIASNQMYLVTTSPENYRDIIHPAFTKEFEDWAVLMHGWNSKGYWPQDILSSQVSGKNHFNNGNSGGFITHQPDWTGNFGSLKTSQPDVVTDFWCFAEKGNKIVRKMGVENSTAISATSKNAERALRAIEKFMTEEAYYYLIQYGIRGRQYDVVNGFAVQPAGYNADVDGGGFAVWSLRNDKFNLPRESEDPRRYTLNEAWNKVAINNPYIGFSFNPSIVASEISSITSVNSQLGIQIMLGKTQDPREAVVRYRNQLTQAGIEKVVGEVKKQLAGFTPVR
ncbi:MAG: extracellular solute-binding protein [Treponema sp.]|jgi:putative aldouronate transport system substrate-binding protein|nr:extracellular solute-binding protein [Treponema sp.]